MLEVDPDVEPEPRDVDGEAEPLAVPPADPMPDALPVADPDIGPVLHAAKPTANDSATRSLLMLDSTSEFENEAGGSCTRASRKSSMDRRLKRRGSVAVLLVVGTWPSGPCGATTSGLLDSRPPGDEPHRQPRHEL
jgi:hypothetical protein